MTGEEGESLPSPLFLIENHRRTKVSQKPTLPSIGTFPVNPEKLPQAFGPLYLTKGIHEWCAAGSMSTLFVFSSLAKYITGNWGEDIDPEDKSLNDEAFRDADGGRLLGSYPLPKGIFADLCPDKKIWIITSGYGNNALGPDHCYTTILWPSEY
jgi:hypothetical protein